MIKDNLQESNAITVDTENYQTEKKKRFLMALLSVTTSPLLRTSQ